MKTKPSLSKKSIHKKGKRYCSFEHYQILSLKRCSDVGLVEKNLKRNGMKA
jgi:hypothetical protein